jgi:hypothetical protein
LYRLKKHWNCSLFYINRALPSLLDSDEEMMTTRYEVNKMQWIAVLLLATRGESNASVIRVRRVLYVLMFAVWVVTSVYKPSVVNGVIFQSIWWVYIQVIEMRSIWSVERCLQCISNLLIMLKKRTLSLLFGPVFHACIILKVRKNVKKMFCVLYSRGTECKKWHLFLMLCTWQELWHHKRLQFLTVLEI